MSSKHEPGVMEEGVFWEDEVDGRAVSGSEMAQKNGHAAW
jgi:hypothetical protein